MNKDFEIDDFTAKETPKKEVINITLSRDKPTLQSLNQKPKYLFLVFGKRPPQKKI